MKKTVKYFILILLTWSCQTKGSKQPITNIKLRNPNYSTQLQFVDTINSIPQLVSLISKSNCVLEREIGFDTSMNITYAYYSRLCKIATDSSLIELTKSKNAVVCVYSFKCLLARKSGLINEALAIMKTNDTTICWQSADMKSIMKKSEMALLLKENYK